jgi:hypothetical protein
LQIFIDDSGSFDWITPDVSVFCGVTVPDRERDALFDRFAKWRRSIIGHSTRELKGAELTDRQLHSFTTKVLPNHPRDFWLTVLGIDTRQTRKVHVEKLREQATALCERSAEIMAEHKNVKMHEQYRQMTGWMRARSPQNLLWIVGLEEALINGLQHSITRLMEPEDDDEFRDIRILIDESFIRREEHVRFWKDYLRNGLSKSSRTEPLHLPDTWKKRGHPFIRTYSIYPGVLDLNHLYWRRMGFFRSRNFVGLQIADICAHAICRYHRGNGAKEAYRRLRPRIVGRDGAEIHKIVVNEKSLHTMIQRIMLAFSIRLRFSGGRMSFDDKQRIAEAFAVGSTPAGSARRWASSHPVARSACANLFSCGD